MSFNISYNHIDTGKHIYIYIYIYACLCVCNYTIYICCIPWWGKKDHSTSLSRTLYSLKDVEASVVYGRRTETGTDKDRLLYWPIISSLNAVLSSRPHLAFLLHLSRGCSTEGRWGQLPSARRSTDCKLALTLAFTDSNWINCRGHLNILFHNTHLLPIRSRDLLSFIYTGASETVRSRVNM